MAQHLLTDNVIAIEFIIVIGLHKRNGTGDAIMRQRIRQAPDALRVACAASKSQHHPKANRLPKKEAHQSRRHPASPISIAADKSQAAGAGNIRVGCNNRNSLRGKLADPTDDFRRV